jgi:pyridoxine/pyridoxamine 5'-phosphate oxidase
LPSRLDECEVRGPFSFLLEVFSMKIADIRTEYRRARLRREDLKADPIGQFNLWLEEACRAGVVEPTAMSLATSSSDGRPLVRTVLLKGLDALGFVFFTNLESRKPARSGRIQTCLCFSPGWRSNVK